MAAGRPVVRRKARPLGPPLAAVGVVLVAAAAVALTVSGPKSPPEYRSPVAVAPVAGEVGAVPTSPTAADPDAVQPAVTTGARAGQPGGSTNGATDGGASASAPSGRGGVAVVIGDGLSASPTAADAFACEAVRRKGWTCRSFAAAGSGYVTAGPRGSYLDQVRRAADVEDVGLVVVSGGTVDRGRPAVAGEAARRLVAEAVFTFPGATVLLVPPFDLPESSAASRASAAAVRDALRAAADGADVQVVDPGRWFRGVSPIVAGDGRSLTEKAAAVAVKRLSSAVPAAADAATAG